MCATATTDCFYFLRQKNCRVDSTSSDSVNETRHTNHPSMIVIWKHRYCSLVELEADAVPLIEASALGYLRSGAESEATLRR